MPTTIVDLRSDVGLSSYQEKAYKNLQVFRRIFGCSPASFAELLPQPEDPQIMQLAKKFGLEPAYIRGVNLSDEFINLQAETNFEKHLKGYGCTSVAKNGVIGQTLDLFVLELAFLKEDHCTYLTMPPYLALLGMGPKLAMCTNHLFDNVGWDGIPVSHLRRELLRRSTIQDALDYLSGIKPTTSVNFLISDGKEVVDVEVTRNGLNIHRPAKHQGDEILVHTNHIYKDFATDLACNRLHAARKRLLEGCTIEQTLVDDFVVQPIHADLEFGTIISVWMDPIQRTIHYRDPEDAGFHTINVD